MFTPAMIASSVSPPATIMSYAFFTPRMPFADAITTGRANVPVADTAATLSRLSASNGAPSATPAAAVAPAERKSRRETDIEAPGREVSGKASRCHGRGNDATAPDQRLI